MPSLTPATYPHMALEPLTRPHRFDDSALASCERRCGDRFRQRHRLGAQPETSVSKSLLGSTRAAPTTGPLDRADWEANPNALPALHRPPVPSVAFAEIDVSTVSKYGLLHLTSRSRLLAGPTRERGRAPVRTCTGASEILRVDATRRGSAMPRHEVVARRIDDKRLASGSPRQMPCPESVGNRARLCPRLVEAHRDLCQCRGPVQVDDLFDRLRHPRGVLVRVDSMCSWK